MTRAILSTMMLAVVLTVMATFATAQEPLLINYQGTLADSTGNPVPDSGYFLMFKLFGDSTGGTALWQESHYPVETSGGLFQVHLGNSYPLDPSTLDTEPLFLEILVQDQTLAPRMRFTQVPEAVYAQHLKGDIETEPGSFLFRSSLGDSAIVFNADGLANAIRVRNMEPPDEHPAIEMRTLADGVAEFCMTDNNGNPALTLVSDAISNAITVSGMDPGDDGIEISSGIGGEASFVMFNPQPEPPEPLIELRTLQNDASYFAMNNLTGTEVGPLLEMTTDPTASSRIKIHAAQPTFSGRVEIQAEYTDGAHMTLFREGATPHNEIKAMDLRVGSDIGGEFKIFNYASTAEQELLSISGSPSSGASFVMFNPQPEPPAVPLMEMMTGLTGMNFNMYSPLNVRTVVDAIQITTSDSGGSMQFYDENGYHVWLSIDPDGSEGNMTFSNSDGMPTVNISSLGYVGIGTENPARNLHVSDVMRLEPRVDFPYGPGEGDLCVVGGVAGNHIYCYLNGSWQQLD